MTGDAARPGDPVSTESLLAWMPHRAPMVWVDDVIRSDASGGECLVRVVSSGLYMGREGVRPSALIEFMAQSFGFISAHHASKSLTASVRRPAKAFLVAVSRAHLGDCSQAIPGTTLNVEVGNLKRFEAITVFDGKVSLSTGKILAEANLKIYAAE